MMGPAREQRAGAGKPGCDRAVAELAGSAGLGVVVAAGGECVRHDNSVVIGVYPCVEWTRCIVH